MEIKSIIPYIVIATGGLIIPISIALGSRSGELKLSKDTNTTKIAIIGFVLIIIGILVKIIVG